MPSGLLLYGSNGFVGGAIASLAVQLDLRLVIAGRDSAKIEAQATDLNVEHRVFSLDDSSAMDKALDDATVVLHCAGPYIYTSRQMVDGCLRTGTHYLDLTGEIPVLDAVAARDSESRDRGSMLLPGAGFDVVATDCLALHLKQRLPSATRLTLAFHSDGPAGPPPGTANTMIEMLPYGNKIRRNGQLETPPRGIKTRIVDFGSGPVQTTLLPWGDVFTAYYSTGIPNIEDYFVMPADLRRMAPAIEYVRPLFKSPTVRTFFKGMVRAGSTADERAKTRTSVWGEVADDQGRKAVSRLHGPDAGVIWTARAALAAVKRVLAEDAHPGFQTPALAYGADFVLECEGVTREDLD